MNIKESVNLELVTKLIVPKVGDAVIKRQQLLDYLNEGIQRHIQVLSAPAGYGKTTLLAYFTNDLDDTPLCWLSLDPCFKDVRLLFDGIIESVRSRFSDFGQYTKPLLSPLGTLKNKSIIWSVHCAARCTRMYPTSSFLC